MVIENERQRNILFSVCLIALAFAISVGWHYAQAQYEGKGYPESTFLFAPGDKFNDFMNAFKALQANGTPYNFYTQSGVLMPYLPLTFVALKPLAIFQIKTAFMVFSLFSIIAFVSIAYFSIFKKMNDRLIGYFLAIIFVVTSYPFLFQLDRGNVEMMVFILMALFLWAFQKNKAWAIIPLAAAIAMKLYPGVFLFLFLGKKQYRSFVFGSLLAILFGFIGYLSISLWSGDTILNIIGQNIHQMSLFTPMYAFSYMGFQHNHTLWGYVIGLNGLIQKMTGSPLIEYGIASKLYAVLAIVLFLLVALFVVFARREQWRKIVALTGCMLVLPYTSFDYTLINWFFAISAYLIYNKNKYSLPYLILILIPFLPVDYILIKNDASISIVIYSITISLAVLFAIFSGKKVRI